MHLPGPLRAAVGLVVSAADEAKHLPDRAIELPMLAVSTALQMSLRAQQRYARLTARGDEVLNRRAATDDVPPWATFDEPVSTEQLRRAAAAQLGDLFGGTDPSGPAGGDPAEGSGTVTPITEATNKAAPPKAVTKASATKAPATKAPAKKAPVTKAPVTKAPAKAAKKSVSRSSTRSAPTKGKSVSKPRHVAPSRFDDAADD